MDSKENRYAVVITRKAETAHDKILDYLFTYYTLDRAVEIVKELRSFTQTLEKLPARGTLEPNLKSRKEEFRFILYKRRSSAQIKIIYLIDENKKVVYITNFFPTEMHPDRIKD